MRVFGPDVPKPHPEFARLPSERVSGWSDGRGRTAPRCSAFEEFRRERAALDLKVRGHIGKDASSKR
jgi:hypothetical protein